MPSKDFIHFFAEDIGKTAHERYGGFFNVFPVLRFSIGGRATGWCSQGCQAIVDTGTSLLTVPQQYMASFAQAVGAQQNQYGEVGEITYFEELGG